MPNQRIALVFQYLGTHFHGWQRQPNNQRTVQEEFEKAVSSVLKRPVGVYAAGRTDAGVHAAAQVAHFDANSPIPPQKWAAVLNSILPEDIVVLGSAGVGFDWHARFSAKWRRYRYTIYTDKQPNLFVGPLAWHYYAPLDESLIQEALNPLLGSRHLAAFHRAGSQRKHSWVEIQAAECCRNGPFIRVEVQANGFLYGMMRLLVGTLVQVGRGQRSLNNFKEIWTSDAREKVKYAAPPHGLCLLRVGYGESPFAPDVWWHDTMPQFILDPGRGQIKDK